MLIYLDSCCINRLFDDPTQERIRLEGEAITLILERVQKGEWAWLSSSIVEAEIAAIADLERRSQVWGLLAHARQRQLLAEEIKQRAVELQRLNIQAFDALHVACAEVTNADIFLTTDDKLWRLAQRAGEQLKVRVANPLAWFAEVIMNECNDADVSGSAP
jgi:predicted nucleic acid-binding protein